jgi:hypothetical protein
MKLPKLSIVKPGRRALVWFCVLLLTSANGFGLYQNLRVQSSSAIQAPAAQQSVSTIDEAVPAGGRKIGEGKYTFESLQSSKIQGQEKGLLTIATHDTSKSNFVLALGAGSLELGQKLNQGWKLTTLAQDGLWQPGACASKPSLLIGDRYVFIDDGKTRPEDPYSSYIIYDIKDKVYRYFGGSNFTEQQGMKETILSYLVEDGQLVFYIDPADKEGQLNHVGVAKHWVQGDHSYIIRRVVAPDLLSYTDYALDFKVPGGIEYYDVQSWYGDMIDGKPSIVKLEDTDNVGFKPSNETSFLGYITDGRIQLSPYTPPSISGPVGSSVTDQEKAINDGLKRAMPHLNDPPRGDFERYNILSFESTILGETSDSIFITTGYVRTPPEKSDVQGYGYIGPAVYSKTSKSAATLTANQYLNYGSYVALGVY